MSCDALRVTGFVDGEFDSRTAAEIEAHLAGCPECRAQAEAERALRGRLRSLPAPDLPAGLEARVREAQRLRPRAVPAAVRFLLPLAAALVLGVWVRGYAPFVAWDLARDHAKCFSKQPLPAKVWSDEPRVVGEWFERQGTPLPGLPGQVGDLRLVGARYCPIASLALAPHVYYASSGSRVSVFLVPQGVRIGERLESRTRGENVRLLRIGSDVIGIVGAREADVQAFEAALRPVLAVLASR